MSMAWKRIIIGLSMSLAASLAQASTPSGPEPTFWFRGAKPPPVEPMRAVPEVMRTLAPIADPADHEVIAENFRKVMGAVPKEGLCMTVGLALLPFEGDEGFYHPFLQWLPYGLLAADIYNRWGTAGIAASAASDNYLDGPILRRHQGMLSARALSFDSPQALLQGSDMNGSVEIVELRIARRETLAAYIQAYPWPDYPYTTVYEGCGAMPLATAGGHSNLADAYLFVRAVVFVPYMVDSGKLTPAARELWREHQNDTMMHEMVHLESLTRILSASADQLRAQAEHDRLKQEDYLARVAAANLPEAPLIREAAMRPKPLEAGDPQLRQYLDFIKRRFDEEAVAYHAFLGVVGKQGSNRRYDNSGNVPPYMDEARARARLQREFDTHEQQVRAAIQGPPAE